MLATAGPGDMPHAGPSPPHRLADDDSRTRARALLDGAPHGALATEAIGPAAGDAGGRLWLPGRGMGMLLSALADHTGVLRREPGCALLLGDVPRRGDPLTHPRITLRGQAVMAKNKADLRAVWLAARPKATLYYDLPDFAVWYLAPTEALLVAGFGRAHRFSRAYLDLYRLPDGPDRKEQS